MKMFVIKGQVFGSLWDKCCSVSVLPDCSYVPKDVP